jgi:hypothetical protein
MKIYLYLRKKIIKKKIKKHYYINKIKKILKNGRTTKQKIFQMQLPRL